MITEKTGLTRIAILFGIACVILSLSLCEVTISYSNALSARDTQVANLQVLVDQSQSEIGALEQQLSSLQNSEVANLTNQIVIKDAQIANLANQIAALNSQISNLQAQIAQMTPNELSIQEEIRDAIMDFIKSNHPETAQFITNLSWAGGRTTPAGLVGAETYMYTSNGWKFTINYPVIPNPTYNITADYSAPSIGIPYRIIWTGSWRNWCINETSYIFAQ